MNVSPLSRSDINDFRELARSSALRNECKLVVVEGFRAIDGAKRSGADIRKIFTTNPQDARFSTYSKSVEIQEVSSKAISRISTTPSPQDAIALCSMPIVPAEFFNDTRNEFLFVLDNISDPGNMGTIFRSCIAFGISGVITVGGCDPYHPKVVRSSAGSLFGCAIYSADEYELAGLLKERTMFTADTNGEAGIEGIRKTDYSAVVFGNEANGIITEYFQNNTVKFSIPMEELCESLNVAMTATIVAHALSSNTGP